METYFDGLHEAETSELTAQMDFEIERFRIANQRVYQQHRIDLD